MNDARQTTVANGPIAAAILSCGLGSFILGVLAVAADSSKSLASALNFYHPAGPLSGVTTVAIALWVAAWFVLAIRWKRKAVAFGKVSLAAFTLLGIGLLLTFPPIGDLFLRR